MNNDKLVVEFLNEEYNSKSFEDYFQVERCEMLEYIPENVGKVLDVGCAAGKFGHLLKRERSVEVWGIEPNETAATAATLRLDKVICNIFSDDLDLPEGYFDCIIFNDVLEHLVDPYTALEYCHKLLTDQGVIVASIPNVRYFDNIWRLLIHKDWKYTDWGILDKTHLRFFTCHSIERTLNELGYSIERLEGINSLEKFHPYHLRKFKVLNWLFPKQVGDMRYLQFAVVARPAIGE
ncbi:class I SAM-dependent methyltransferase [Leptolyngbya sp. NK1-12]|uniref:Class I SAM-dependent methyltransferase n=1 Tax=Leptolyngbya sp. NK1-12 TaxID=2547451 RepID=A0AA96WLJ1_9CYAN|nr:class I SAM-dependent methyltransferase [Leptolyngbya sp. NK1-12]WNZ27295.1 class I SAM-dependent methyltransferase [Leptolyngbya sp. NK1-12]